MSWVDEGRQRVAKRKAAEEAEKAKASEKWNRREEARQTEVKRDLKRYLEGQLPRGVKLVSVYYQHGWPIAQILVGNGLVLDVIRTYSSDISPPYSIAVYESGKAQIGPSLAGLRYYGGEIGKSSMEEILLKALDEHHQSQHAP
jgi:hypothetical protein